MSGLLAHVCPPISASLLRARPLHNRPGMRLHSEPSRARYWIVYPPSTTRFAPVIIAAASLDKKSAAAAISSG